VISRAEWEGTNAGRHAPRRGADMAPELQEGIAGRLKALEDASRRAGALVDSDPTRSVL